MTWTIPLILTAAALGAGVSLWGLRRHSARRWRQAGVVLLKGRIFNVAHETEAPQGDDPALWPALITLCTGGRRQEVLLNNPQLDRGWSRSPLSAGDRVRIEAVWVNRSFGQPSYREAAKPLTLEALSVQLCRGVLLRRCCLSTGAALVLALGLFLAPSADPQEDRLAAIIDTIECPAKSQLQRVNLKRQGRLGFCLQGESGLRHGPWLQLSVRGIKLVEGTHARGQRHRLWTVRSAAGQALSWGRYDHGQQQGRWRYWDSAGHELPSARFVHGWPTPPAPGSSR